MLKDGMDAPDFCLEGIDKNGKEIKPCLKDLLNEKKEIILYFYPRDNTPGCTTEACDFRDNLRMISKKAIVIGISPDSISSHLKFRDKYNLNFILLSDPEHKVMESYEAWGEKKMYGKTTIGVIRSTFIIDSKAIIKKKFSKVKVKGHVEKLMTYIE